MARIRTIKPDFFRHEGLFDAEIEERLPLRLAFAGLWTVADREGRFKWRPRAIKTECLPYDDVDFARVLDALATRGFVVRYRVNNEDFGLIPSFTSHQVINNREAASELPEPNENNILSHAPRVPHACPTPLEQDQGEGKGREGKGRDNSDANASAPASSADPKRELYARAEIVLGKGSGGLVTKLLKAKRQSIPLARAAIEQASEAHNAREYLGRIIAGTGPPENFRDDRGRVLDPEDMTPAQFRAFQEARDRGEIG